MFKPGDLVRVCGDPNKIGTVISTDAYRVVKVPRSQLYAWAVSHRPRLPSGNSYVDVASMYMERNYRLRPHEIILIAEDRAEDSISIKFKQVEVKLWSDTSNSLHCSEHVLEHVNDSVQKQDKPFAYSF